MKYKLTNAIYSHWISTNIQQDYPGFEIIVIGLSDIFVVRRK